MITQRSILMTAGGIGTIAAAFVAAVVLRAPNGPTFSPETFTGELIAKSPAGKPDAGSPPSKSFSISGSVVDLYPGATKTLTLRFDNPLQQSITVVSANVTVQSTNKPGCLTSAVTPTNYTAPAGGGVVVKKKGSATLQLPITMAADAQNACSGATFSLAYGGQAVQS